jgi:hypothetical protein
MRYLENSTKVHLMTWETDPRKRNVNNRVSLILHETEKLNELDVVFVKNSNEMQSCYEVVEILETRPAAMKKHIHYVVKTKWNYRSLRVIEAHDHVLISYKTLKSFSDFVKNNAA